MKLSIVTTLYLSESYINQFYKRLLNTITNLNIVNYEIIFVDDHSPDNSLNLACEIAKKDNQVRVIELSRNFGHHKAMMTGLKNASGDKIFLIDSDLEEKPEYLKNFISAMNENDSDVVFGVQDKRKGKRFERLTGKIFWKSLKKITGLPFKENQKYIFEAITNENKTIVVKTPLVEKLGISLNLENDLKNNRFLLNITTNSNTLEEIKGKKYKIFIHNTRKYIQNSIEFNEDKKDYSFILEKNNILDGININTVFNEENKPI